MLVCTKFSECPFFFLCNDDHCFIVFLVSYPSSIGIPIMQALPHLCL